MSELLLPSTRLHPASVLIGIGRGVRAAIPVVAVSVLSWPWWVLGVIGSLVLVYAVLRWYRTSYAVTAEEFQYRTGVLSRSVRSVALGRVTGVTDERGLVQRAFGVWSVQVQTPGDGDAATVTLDCVRQADVDRLRLVLGTAGLPAAHPTTGPDPAAVSPVDPAVMPPAPEVAPVIATLGTRALLLTAVTGTSVPLVLAGLGAVWNRASEVLPDGSRAWLRDRVSGVGVLVVLLVVLGVAVLAGVTATALRLARFTLRRSGDRVRTTRGLISERAGTIVARRVRAVRLVEGLWRHLLGYTAVQVEVAGFGVRTGAEAEHSRLLFPLVRTPQAASLVARALPELGWVDRELTRPPRRVRRGYLVLPTMAGSLLAAPLIVAAAAGTWSWWPVPIPVVLGAALGWAQGRSAAWSLDEATVILRQRRILSVHTVVARTDRVQRITLSTSPFQRRSGAARVTLHLSSGRSARLRHLDRAAAELLLRRVGRRLRPQ